MSARTETPSLISLAATPLVRRCVHPTRAPLPCPPSCGITAHSCGMACTPLVRHGAPPTRAAWRAPHSCPVAVGRDVPIAPPRRMARCAALHRTIIACGVRTRITRQYSHAHYTRPRDDAARWGHRALPPLRTPITWQYSYALPPYRTRFARGGSPPPVRNAEK